MKAGVKTRHCFVFHDMSDEEKKVWGVLRARRGRRNAITQKALGRECGLHPRDARKIVKALIERHGRSIGASYAHNGGGYYVTMSEKERKESHDLLYRHALSMLKRASVFKKLDWKTLQLELFRREKHGE